MEGLRRGWGPGPASFALPPLFSAGGRLEPGCRLPGPKKTRAGVEVSESGKSQNHGRTEPFRASLTTAALPTRTVSIYCVSPVPSLHKCSFDELISVESAEQGPAPRKCYISICERIKELGRRPAIGLFALRSGPCSPSYFVSQGGSCRTTSPRLPCHWLPVSLGQWEEQAGNQGGRSQGPSTPNRLLPSMASWAVASRTHIRGSRSRRQALLPSPSSCGQPCTTVVPVPPLPSWLPGSAVITSSLVAWVPGRGGLLQRLVARVPHRDPAQALWLFRHLQNECPVLNSLC